MMKKLSLIIALALLSVAALPSGNAEAQAKYKGKACGNSSGWC